MEEIMRISEVKALHEGNIFSYKVTKNGKCAKKIAEMITEELNKGLSFVLSETDEKTVSLRGKRKLWATTFIDKDRIYLYIDDEFFRGYCGVDRILTCLWANLLDFGHLQLEDIQLSKKVHHLLFSPIQGKICFQELVKIKGPYFGTIYKPSFGLSLKEKVTIATKFASLGGTFIKEDETYFVSKDKLIKHSKIIQEAMNKVSDCCFYVPNVTPYLMDEKVFQKLCEIGIQIIMVNYLIVGLPTLHAVGRKYRNMLFWGHRVGYKALQKCISMKAMASIAAYCGADIIHVGTPFLSSDISIRECVGTIEAMKRVKKEVLPVFTKMSIQLTPKLVELFGKDIIVLACGGLRTNGTLNWRKVKRWIKVEEHE